ncbi:hypothetical protein GCM10023147_51500 [Tsukamurella soli]|uniref:DUF2530 domain-containing protein n=1 Tax=Tsukamurella soli TaxID=644556 RepID=A0ABP8KHZ8_9ACTN
MLWLVALIVTTVFHGTFGDAWITCVAGVAVGVFGTVTFVRQRHAARRGARGAQQGLV